MNRSFSKMWHVYLLRHRRGFISQLVTRFEPNKIDMAFNKFNFREKCLRKSRLLGWEKLSWKIVNKLGNAWEANCCRMLHKSRRFSESRMVNSFITTLTFSFTRHSSFRILFLCFSQSAIHFYVPCTQDFNARTLTKLIDFL